MQKFLQILSAIVGLLVIYTGALMAFNNTAYYPKSSGEVLETRLNTFADMLKETREDVKDIHKVVVK